MPLEWLFQSYNHVGLYERNYYKESFNNWKPMVVLNQEIFVQCYVLGVSCNVLIFWINIIKSNKQRNV